MRDHRPASRRPARRTAAADPACAPPPPRAGAPPSPRRRARSGRSARPRRRAPPSSRPPPAPAGRAAPRSTPARGGQPLGGALERDEEVGGDRGGGVVGGAVLVATRVARMPKARRQRLGDGERPRRRAVDRAAGAGQHVGRRPGGHGHQRVQRERLVRRQHVEPGGARAVADERARGRRRPPRRRSRRPARTAARARAARVARPAARADAGAPRAAASAVPRRPAPTMAMESSSLTEIPASGFPSSG